MTATDAARADAQPTHAPHHAPAGTPHHAPADTPHHAPAAPDAGATPLVLIGAGVALTALVVALLLAGGAPQVLAPGLGGADEITRWLVPVGALATRSAGLGTVGCLVVALLLPAGAGRQRLRTAGGRWAVGWAWAAVLSALLVAADTTGRSLGALVRDGAGELTGAPAARALLLTALVAATVAAWPRRAAGRVLLALALAGLLPTVLTGHAATGSDRALSVAALGVHVLAVAVWVGGLGAIVLSVRTVDLRAALPGYSRLALGCFVLAGASGAVGAALHLPAVTALWSSGYGALLLAKATALVVLGALGARHRRATLPAVSAGRPGAFGRLAGGELLVMATAVALGVALARTPL